jgi:DNA-directed RNA polymerase subunit RPC12/RpoP
MRYMCLACGHFFDSETPYVVGTSKCPVCRDTYFVDNVLPDVPPPVDDLKAWQTNRLEELGL